MFHQGCERVGTLGGHVVTERRQPLLDCWQRQDCGKLAMLSGGDDYEIVCTVRPARLSSFQAAARAIGLPVTAVGRIVSGGGATFRGADGRPMGFARGSFSHF